MSSYHASAPVPTKPLGSARTLVRAGFTPLTENEQPFTHAPAGRRSQTRVILVVRDQRNREPLFLTSKVRLHCDVRVTVLCSVLGSLFLTSKVRLHCDLTFSPCLKLGAYLFLTSKVRLHCDLTPEAAATIDVDPFPDLKGQAPLRQLRHLGPGTEVMPFPDLKGQAPLRLARVVRSESLEEAFS